MSVFAPASLQYALQLRHELSVRNRHFAELNRLPHCLSYGEMPAVVYESYAGGALHGNFLPAAYQLILQNANWRKRLKKHHAQAKKSLPVPASGRWGELDSSNSSDALLMNIFCYPGVLKNGRIRLLLGIEDDDAVPEYGHKACVPLANGKVDRTEADMLFGELLIEAKLTEGDFQFREKVFVDRYRDLDEVFDRKLLPLRNGGYAGYQLIRNVLAAYATDRSFCVLCDERRPDLKEIWYSVLRAVKLVELRTRCKMITWQELREVLPEELRKFLAEKYGIVSQQESEETLTFVHAME